MEAFCVSLACLFHVGWRKRRRKRTIAKETGRSPHRQVHNWQASADAA